MNEKQISIKVHLINRILKFSSTHPVHLSVWRNFTPTWHQFKNVRNPCRISSGTAFHDSLGHVPDLHTSSVSDLFNLRYDNALFVYL